MVTKKTIVIARTMSSIAINRIAHLRMNVTKNTTYQSEIAIVIFFICNRLKCSDRSVLYKIAIQRSFDG